jgi:hypothetical protein
VRRRQALLTPLVLTGLASMLQASTPAFAEESVMEQAMEAIEQRDLAAAAAEAPSTSTSAAPTVYSSSKVRMRLGLHAWWEMHALL